MPCEFDLYAGKCGRPAQGRFCEQHTGLKCASCGKPATRECPMEGTQFTCGSPLCDDCEHGEPEPGKPGMFNLAGGHRPKRRAARPSNLRQLVDHLTAHPLVTMETDSPRIPVGGPGQNPETFLRLADGLLWFRNASGAEHHLPLHCGLEAAALHESGVTIRDDGFDFTKFGQTIRVRYVASEPAPALVSVATVPRTPGPWEMIEPAAIDYRAPLVYGANRRSLVAYMEGGGPERAVTAAEARANGRFIAAAPDFEEATAFFVLYAMRYGPADQLPPELVAWAESFRFSDRTGAEVALSAIRKTKG